MFRQLFLLFLNKKNKMTTELVCVCVCVCAVSYTHLDVYKRQVNMVIRKSATFKYLGEILTANINKKASTEERGKQMKIALKEHLWYGNIM